MRLEGKAALVTGASSGIGLGIARRLAEDGAKVCLTGNSHIAEAEQLAEEIVGAGGEALAVKVDLLSMADIDNLVNTAIDHLGSIDILVNNAGVFYIRLLEELTEHEWNTTIDVNVKASFFLTQKVVPHMVNVGKGSVVFIGSTAGQRGMPAAASYGASKMALLGLTTCLAIELAPSGIRVNAVTPGNTDTPMNEELYKKFGGREAFRVQYPIGRLGSAGDVANAVSYLVSDEADWVTGAILPIDGGFLAK
jgi:3-oxoacyl-[acyl-carrier protein] reductase